VLASEITALKARLKETLKRELPGEKTHRLLLPPGRELNPIGDTSTILQSSVLMLLFPVHEKINTCLIRRPATMRNHSGQIAFPGGKYELSDKNLIQTALRESFEEIGTESNHVEIIGALTPLYVQVSNFIINPFLGWSDTIPDFKIDNHEVESLIIIPVEKLVHHSTFQVQKVTTIHGTFEAPGFYVEESFIWGATAMIISEFNEIYRS
jgi:8-oxo-dGTP pyrophosphatase MutT (NUDIX family)